MTVGKRQDVSRANSVKARSGQNARPRGQHPDETRGQNEHDSNSEMHVHKFQHVKHR